MNDKTILMLAFGTAAVLMVMMKKKAASTTSDSAGWVTPIEVPTGSTNGWKYYTDGTAISPDGTYYYQGAAVWNPMMK